ncbi:hypothetical protein HW555_006182 [Spodoptera exigua]|uniref:FP protein C-terminal domain-containing protein n=1 Tax=Spodoptera exigua TaxID=7107 RepID=A0A835GH49_SPOEX|nr:hypothetical protein HW555_006182 [Spodoptera exigua]
MFTCASCGFQHAEGPVCSVCKQQYDYQCSGVSEAGYRRLGDARKSAWRCPKCKSSSSLSPLALSPQPTSQLDRMQEQLNKITSDLTPLATLAADVKSIKSELTGLKDSMEMAHEIINRFSEKVNAVESKVTKLENAASQVTVLQAHIDRISRDLQDREQWARANNAEIKGIPQKSNENLYDIAQKIGSLCNVTVRKEDINYIARIPTRVPNAVKPIIVAFNNRYMKEEFVSSSRKSKQLNISNLGFSSSANFYVNDHLTTTNKSLLSKARTLARDNNFKYVWVKNCKILAKQSDTTQTFFIKCEKDLQRITNRQQTY